MQLAEILRHCGKYDEALLHVREGIRGLQALFGADHPVMARPWIIQAEILLAVAITQADLSLVEELLVKASNKLQCAFSVFHPDVLRCSSNLALVLLAQGKCDAAITQNRLVLEARMQGPYLSPGTHPSTFGSKYQLAESLRQMYGSRHAECAQLSESVLKERTALLAEGTAKDANYHPDQLASLHQQAIVLSGQAQAGSALEKIELVLQGRAAILPSSHPDIFSALS